MIYSPCFPFYLSGWVLGLLLFPLSSEEISWTPLASSAIPIPKTPRFVFSAPFFSLCLKLFNCLQNISDVLYSPGTQHVQGKFIILPYPHKSLVFPTLENGSSSTQLLKSNQVSFLISASSLMPFPQSNQFITETSYFTS